ncbi:APC family permease [Streptomycetaceae bacterium NBC_01309]
MAIEDRPEDRPPPARASALQKAPGLPGLHGLPGALRRRSPLAGLDRRNLAAPQVWAQSVSAVAPSAAMATTPALVATAAGRDAVWAVGVAAVVALLVAYCVAQFARRMAAAGSLYTFTAKGLGPLPGVVCGAALLIGYAFLTMAALVGCAAYLHAFAVRAGWSSVPVAPTTAVLVVAATAAVVACVVRGVRLSSGVALASEAVSIVFVVFVLATTLRGGAGGGPGGGLSGIAAGSVLALSAFIGFESAAALGAEARRPFRVVPNVVRGTVLGAGVLYLFATYAQTRSSDGRPPHAAAGGIAPYSPAETWSAVVLDVGLAASFFACALASGTALARLLFCMGREAVGPRGFGRTHPRHRSPHVAAFAMAPVLAGVPCVLLATGSSPADVFGTLTGMFTYGHMLAYLLVCVAAPVFLRRIGELTVRPVLAAAVAVPVLALVSAAYSRSAAPGSDDWVLVGFAGLMALALAWFARRRPKAIGVYDETTADDLLGAEFARAAVRTGG